MLNTERPQFEAELAVLFGGYPTFLTPPRIEAYWRGLQKMQLTTFVRCVSEVLGEGGSDKLPTVNAIWQISRTLRATPPQQPRPVEATVHPLQGAANSALLSLLRTRGPTTEACIHKLVSLKNQIVSDLPADADPAEVRDVLLKAFERIWEPETEADREAALRRFRSTPNQSQPLRAPQMQGSP
jgi:hypothetical protein